MDDPARAGRAISPVLGVALLLVVVVALSFTTGILFLGAAGTVTERPTWLGSGGTVHATIASNETTNTLERLHLSGSELAVDDLRVVVTSGNGGAAFAPAADAAGSDGAWSSGERLSIDLPTEQVCAGDPDEVAIRITHRTGGGTYTITTQSYPVTRDQFVIEDGRVVPLAGYTATVKLLGTAITYGAGGPSIPVYVDLTIGGTTVEPGGDVNDGNNPRSYSVGDRSAGTEIAVNVTADAPYYHRMVSSTHAHSDLVNVLRDGDDAPSTQGFANQAGAGSFVSPYVDNGTVALEENQAIYLFELGANDPDSPATDFQDAVVLVSLYTDQGVRLANGTRTDDLLVCPRNAS